MKIGHAISKSRGVRTVPLRALGVEHVASQPTQLLAMRFREGRQVFVEARRERELPWTGAPAALDARAVPFDLREQRGDHRVVAVRAIELDPVPVRIGGTMQSRLD